MRILACHNYYRWFGGEDLSFEGILRLLRRKGHAIIPFTVHNDDIEGMNPLAVSLSAFWNRRRYKQLRGLIRRERPQVMYCENTFPLLSPSLHSAAKAEGIPVVQTLSNFRIECVQSSFSRGGHPCRDCAEKKLPWPAIRHRCYRDSLPASMVVASMQVLHRFLRWFSPNVDIYLALSHTARRAYVRAGISPAKIMVKPCFLDPDPGIGGGGGGYAVFAGRLAPEKGLDTLLAAWSRIHSKLPLKIIGDGPLAERVRQTASMNRTIEWMGHRSLPEVLSIVGGADFLVCPSIAHETFGRIVMEALAKGTPVIASKIGALAELVADGYTGFLFEPANAEDLVTKILKFIDNPAIGRKMRKAARADFKRKYSGEMNYRILMSAFHRASSKPIIPNFHRKS